MNLDDQETGEDDGIENCADIFELLMHLATENDWSHSFSPSESSLTLVMTTKVGVRQIQVLYDAEKAFVSLVTVHELQAEPPNLVRFYECINSETIIAQQTVGGGFTYIAELGVIVLRIGQTMIGIPTFTEDWAYKMLDDCTSVMVRAEAKFAALELPEGSAVSPALTLLMNSQVIGRA